MRSLLLSAAPLLLACAAGAAAAAPQSRADERAERARREELRVQMSEADPARRRSAVLALCKAGKTEDWLLVVDALADRESQVADTAQLRLGALDRPELLPKLYGRGGLQAKEELVRWRAAEALGRVALPVDGELLVARLTRGDARLSRLLLWSIERQAGAGRLEGRVPRIAHGLESFRCTAREGELQAAALLALAAVDREAARLPAAAARRERDGAVRCAALLAAAAAGWPEAAEWARASASDPEARVRVTALEGLRAAPSVETLRVLVERLAAETGPALRLRVLAALQELSGMKYHLNPGSWRSWVDSVPPDWTPARKQKELEREATAVEPEPRLPVLADRLCFLFDFSGSMWTSLPDGRQPKDIVGAKLREALEGLDPGVRFNLIPYAHNPHPWEPRLAQAKTARVREALAFFDGCTVRGRGNFHAAAELALADPDVERIVTLTDGVPTGGEHCDMDLIVPLLLARNRFRQVAFDTVLVDAPPSMRRRWRELAAASGGRVLEVDMR